MIQAVGVVRAVRPHGGGARIHVECHLAGEPLVLGESIAVNGACLSVAGIVQDGLVADMSRETLARTTLGMVRSGGKVNLERALRLGDRLGGHLVLGHVDATSTVVAVRPEGEFRTSRVALPSALGGEVAEKGSIAVDGVSLTVSALGAGWFEVALVPATLSGTTLATLGPGARVNLETDVLAKYVNRAVAGERRGVAGLWEGFASAPD